MTRSIPLYLHNYTNVQTVGRLYNVKYPYVHIVLAAQEKRCEHDGVHASHVYHVPYYYAQYYCNIDYHNSY